VQGDLLAVQVRVTDTGGNVTLSTPVEVQLIPDITQPTIVSTNVPDDAIRGSQFRTLKFRFSESMDTSALTATQFSLVGPAGAIQPEEIVFSRNNREVQLVYPALALGNYQLTLKSNGIKDLAGNALGASDIVNEFRIYDHMGSYHRWKLE
jgi:Bacterial Ig-like domain